MVHRWLQIQGALPGEQLQHLRLGDPQEPQDWSGVVRGPQQEGESENGLQPKGQIPACVHAFFTQGQPARQGRAGFHHHGQKQRQKENPAGAAA